MKYFCQVTSLRLDRAMLTQLDPVSGKLFKSSTSAQRETPDPSGSNNKALSNFSTPSTLEATIRLIYCASTCVPAKVGVCVCVGGADSAEAQTVRRQQSALPLRM